MISGRISGLVGVPEFDRFRTGKRVNHQRDLLQAQHREKGTGRRVKADTPAMRWDYITGRYLEDVGGSDKVYFAGRRLMKGREEEPNLKQCLFGEHLLRQPGRVAIVESEKTAIVSSRHFPGFIWLATGGSNGARFTEPDVCRVLDGREVVLFPDVGMYDR